MIRIAALLIALMTVPATAQVEQGRKNVPEFKPAFKNQTRAPEIRKREAFRVTRVASGLAHPWGIAVLPGGGYLVTEREGRLNHISQNGKVTRVGGLPEVAAVGQGGLLDVAVPDDFAQTRRVFLTVVQPVGRKTATTAVSATLSKNNKSLSGVRTIFAQTPAIASGAHFGSRIVLDGNHAYVTIGDRGSPEIAQELSATVGKVVRVTIDGGVPRNNPFANRNNAQPEIWSYGHRNQQGAAINPATGDLWTLEHGPKGGDELNRIERGKNYGWPVVTYGENYDGTPVGRGRPNAPGLAQPQYYWDPVIAPGNLVFYDGNLFPGWQGDIIAASLRPGGLVRLQMNGNRVAAEARYLRDLGRVRDVEVDRDGSLLVLTDDPSGGVFRVRPR